MLAIESLGRSLDLVLDSAQVSDYWRYAVAIFDGSDHIAFLLYLAWIDADGIQRR